MSWDNRVQRSGDLRLPASEPNHFVVPFLSRRKTSGYGEDIREQKVLEITSDMTNLAAKLSRLANPAFPAHRRYADSCEAVLGFVVTAIPAVNGQRPGVYLPDQTTIPIEQMGEGVPNIVQLLCHLAVSRGKLFLIEEPENDLHPLALKALLNLILASAAENQFVVSTHSNIVVSHLCSAPNSRLFKVSSLKGKLPVEATIAPVPQAAEARIGVLQELGYAFSDFDLWDGWLLLEEASAECIIRDYLVPWFAPGLRRIKTVSAGGASNVEPAFVDLHRLMLFTHLQPAYAGKAWVRVDGDEAGHHVIERLRAQFSSVAPGHFRAFAESQFERYYPEPFSGRSAEVLGIADRKVRRCKKRELLQEVLAWLDVDAERAKASLASSAKEVIDDLRTIERELVC